MKWIKKKSPVRGDIKVKHKFLWFPVCIDRNCRWLENASIRYVFEGWDYTNMDCNESQLWIPTKFID